MGGQVVGKNLNEVSNVLSTCTFWLVLHTHKHSFRSMKRIFCKILPGVKTCVFTALSRLYIGLLLTLLIGPFICLLINEKSLFQYFKDQKHQNVLQRWQNLALG